MSDTRSRELSVAGEIESMEEELAGIRERAAELKRDKEALGGGRAPADDAEREARRAELKDAEEEVKARFASVRSRLEAFRSFREERLGGGEGRYVVRELTFGELMRARDEVSQESFRADPEGGGVEGVPRDGFYRVKTLEYGVEESPDDAPDPRESPYHIGQWLYDEIDEFNTGASGDLGNSSLGDIAEGGTS